MVSITSYSFNVKIGQFLTGQRSKYLKTVSETYDDIGRKHGVCEYSFEIVKIFVTYTNGEVTGPASFVYELTDKIEKLMYVNGVIEGEMYVYDHGVISEILTFNNGVKIKNKVFGRDTVEECEYDENGCRHGYLRIYKDDVLIEETKFKHGYLNGISTLYDDTGRKIESAYFKENTIIPVDCEKMTGKDWLYLEMSGRVPDGCQQEASKTVKYAVRILEATFYRIFQ